MSLVDLFFNSNYREKCSSSSKKQLKDNRTEEQKIKDRNKFWRDYHLDKMRELVWKLQTEILYDFIKIENVNEDNFTKYLKNNRAEDWCVKLLWKEFLLKNKI